MNVLMLGWEFPPYFAGGVGVVCEALSKALVRRGDRITFVMPSGPRDVAAPHLRLIVTAHHVSGARLVRIASLLEAYQGEAEYFSLRRAADAAKRPSAPLYGPDLLTEVRRFAAEVVEIADDLDLQFDVIHAHDWTTFEAGIRLKTKTGKPLVVHVHITEFDKTGGAHADPRIYEMEAEGMHRADAVVAVSRFLRQRVVRDYGVDPGRVHVVHNALERTPPPARVPGLARGKKVVLFLGRVTLQKGPDYFVEAARRVLDLDPNVTFVLAGAGDMTSRLVHRSAELGIGSRMLFTGFVTRDEAARLHATADVFVMPSVSEPFGLVALEAVERGVPVIISRQSGAAEVLPHTLKIDFWDVDDIADKILAALNYGALRREISGQAERTLGQITWDDAARRLQSIYRNITEPHP